MSLNPEKEKSLILNLYAAFGISLVFLLIPFGASFIVSIIFMLGAFIGSYIIRKKSEENSLTFNHTTYLIRTIWIGSLLSFINIFFLFILYLLSNTFTTIRKTIKNVLNNLFDFSSIDHCFAKYSSLASQNIHGQPKTNLLQQCITEFYFDNILNFILIIFILFPVYSYLLYRVFKGIIYGSNTKKLSSPKTWF